MNDDLQEKLPHGTSFFPLQVYSHQDKNGFYFVCQHWHEELEWIYVENGVLHLTVRGKAYTLRQGQFCFINSQELHEIRSVGSSLHHAVVFRADFLDFSYYDACQHNFIRPVTGQRLLFPSGDPALPAGTADKISGHMREIVRLYHTLPKCALLSIKLHILHILELLFEADIFYEADAPLKENAPMNQLKLALSYIQEHYMSPISLQTLAQLCYMSPNYFCSLFHRELGKTPVTFVNEFRIQKAAQLLADTELSVSQIAASAGFPNFSYFIRKFREQKGVTPTEYRRIVRAEAGKEGQKASRLP
ncbi:MAG: AraC family transcriptional regulator [Eubacteriales bacterium]|nr:AraC family transcriptional regulator [Eubacteriales bacterium]